MLKKIDQSDIDKLDDAQRQNLMVNAEGEYVFAQADEKAWKKHLEQVKAAEAAQKKVAVGDKELQDRGLECPIDKRLFVDPMKTPCCGKTYCHDCIENALLENDLTCPGCETENISLERLEPDEEMKNKIKEYEAEKSNAKQRSRSPTVAAETPQPNGNGHGSTSGGSRPTSRDGSGSPKSQSQQANGQSKKRRASDAAAEESSTPSSSGDADGAPAMKRQKSGGAEQSSSTPKPEEAEENKEADGKDSSVEESNNAFPANMMPPDFSQMQSGGAGINMNMPMMPNFNPFMMNPMAMGMGMGMPGMPGMGMNGMPGMPGMPNMPGMPGMGMNGMNGMNFMNPNFNMAGMNGMNMFPQGNSGSMPNWNMNGMNQGPNRPNGYNGYKPPRNFQSPNQPPKQPAGMSGVPTGPKALTQAQQQAANKFSNQQRHVGNEEDNAYMRQPVNPHRHINRNRKARQPDYREL